jgi:hypothetical protein
MCPWKQGHIYTYVLQLFTELMALPPNAIGIKCYDFEGSMNTNGHFVPQELIQF